MNEHDGSKPPAQWLNHLHEAGHWDRLIEMATRSLAAEPNDPDAHRHLAWAYAKTGRIAEMRRHVDFLLKAEPAEPRNHHLAAIYCLETRQHKRAQRHVDFLLLDNPNSAIHHYLACIQALRCYRMADARTHISRTRALAPNWAPAAHLEINMDGMRQRTANEAWARIARLKRTLSLDPRDADVMTSIGDIFLKELERPREAEGFFREALLIDPTDKERQAKLLDSIRARSLFYRTLSLPTSAVHAIRKTTKGRTIWWLFVIIAFHAVLLFVAWLIVVGLFFAPAARIYEWFVLADITRTKEQPRILAPLRNALMWPLCLRMTVALTTIALAWLLILSTLFHVTPMLSLQIMAATFGLHVAAVGYIVGLRKVRASFGHWQEVRRLRREASHRRPSVQATFG